MNTLIIDNYDSFTFNLAHYFEALGCDVVVHRVDDSWEENWQDFDALVLSPGPGLPSESPALMQWIDRCFGKIPILGVCLGLQALVEYKGGKLFNLSEVKHGVQRSVFHTETGIFSGVPNPTDVGLYHSWAADPQFISPDFSVVAHTDQEVVMAIESPENQMAAVQFHPESILSSHGKKILSNWLEQYVGFSAHSSPGV